MVTGMNRTRRTDARLLRMLPIAAVATFGIAIGAYADVSTTSPASKPALVRRLEADEVQARILENRIDAAQQQAGVVRTAALFGESDEEKAARLAHEQSQDASIS